MKLLVMRILVTWGLQMGLIITELKEENEILFYFDLNIFFYILS